ncbi:hypothetical protein [Nocardioides panacisoli]|uniref:Uncharacterized protein n=1 Tax=Nocardioides panacisoli TaxID=627624 RepID=A0ABP7J343_9ACTN
MESDGAESVPFTVSDTAAADPEDWVMNEVGINYNAPAVLHFALLSSH